MQWVPKTAWKRNSLAGTYGPEVLGLVGRSIPFHGTAGWSRATKGETPKTTTSDGGDGAATATTTAPPTSESEFFVPSVEFSTQQPRRVFVSMRNLEKYLQLQQFDAATAVTGAQPQQQQQQTSSSSVIARQRRANQELHALGIRPAVPFIDVRDLGERQASEAPHGSGKRPASPCLVPLHVHDLLSGACEYILPKDKDSSDLVVISSDFFVSSVVGSGHSQLEQMQFGGRGWQRAVNAYNALRTAGYRRVAVAEFDAIVEMFWKQKELQEQNPSAIVLRNSRGKKKKARSMATVSPMANDSS